MTPSLPHTGTYLLSAHAHLLLHTEVKLTCEGLKKYRNVHLAYSTVLCCAVLCCAVLCCAGCAVLTHSQAQDKVLSHQQSSD